MLNPEPTSELTQLNFEVYSHLEGLHQQLKVTLQS